MRFGVVISGLWNRRKFWYILDAGRAMLAQPAAASAATCMEPSRHCLNTCDCSQNMKRPIRMFAARALIVAGTVFSSAAQADVELAAPDGRRILLKDNGTWLYVEAERTASTINKDGEAILVLERKVERGKGCRIAVRLENNLPYEIRSLVPYYSVYRANGVIYDTVSGPSSFTSLKPGDVQRREIDFVGISCQDIARVQVVGGDRCEMGELTKYSATTGQCLERVRVVKSDLLRFDK